MNLRLQREDLSADRTIGRIYVDGQFSVWSLEDRVRLTGPKIQGQTAIPAGNYKVIIDRSVRFERMLPLLLNVPNFTGIRIHPGNVAADTDGCILVGQGRLHDSIMQSQLAQQALQSQIAGALARGESVTISVENPHETDQRELPQGDDSADVARRRPSSGPLHGGVGLP